MNKSYVIGKTFSDVMRKSEDGGPDITYGLKVSHILADLILRIPIYGDHTDAGYLEDVAGRLLTIAAHMRDRS